MHDLEMVRDALEPADPTPAVLAARRADLLRHIADNPAGHGGRRAITANRGEAPPRRRTLRRHPMTALLGAAAAAAAITLGVTASGAFGPDATAYAATPPALQVQGRVGLQALQLAPDAGAEATLRAIAARVERLPDDRGRGRYAKLVTDGWYLHTTVGDEVTSTVVPETTTLWRAADGSGRLVRSRAGRPLEDQRLRAGEAGFGWPLGTLSTDPTVLARQLEEGHPAANGAAERLEAVGDVHRDQPLSPAVRAAVLRYLAETPGLELTGAVTDRAGRRGVAVSVHSELGGLPNRRTVIVDARTGRLLGEEQTLTEDAGALDVRIPAVVSYTVHRESVLVPKAGPAIE